MPDLEALSAFAANRRHNLTGRLRHGQVTALARAWFPEIRFHEEERFHPVDLPALLDKPVEVFAGLPDAEKEPFRVIGTTVVGGEPVVQGFDPPILRQPFVGGNLVTASGPGLREALADPGVDAGAVYSHGHRLEAALKFFGASTSVQGAASPTPRDPRRPRHPIVVRAEMRVLLDTLRLELELDDLPPGLERPIDAIWNLFAVEESFFREDADPQTSQAPFPRAAMRAILAAMIAAQEIADPAARAAAEAEALARIPRGWSFVPLAWTVITDFAFLEFYLVYAFNDYKEYGTWPFDNEHEGDVEGCCVVFRRSALEEFAAGATTAAEVVPHTVITVAHEEFNELDDLKRLPATVEEAHRELVVYVAAGSHGSYLTPGFHDILDFEDIVNDLPGELPTWLLALLTVTGLFIPAVLIVGLLEHFIDSEDETTDDGVRVGPGPPDEANLTFDKEIEVTPLSAFQGGANIYQPQRRALLALRGYPGKWGADEGLLNKSAPWKNKTDRYFRQFLARGQIVDPIL